MLILEITKPSVAGGSTYLLSLFIGTLALPLDILFANVAEFAPVRVEREYGQLMSYEVGRGYNIAGDNSFLILYGKILFLKNYRTVQKLRTCEKFGRFYRTLQ